MFPINNPSYNVDGFSQATSMIVTTDSNLTAKATLANPFPDGFQQPTGSSLGIATNLGKSFNYYNPTIHNPYSVRWEMGMQRELPGGMVLELAYIGNHAVHLLLNRNMDALPAKYLSTSPVRDQATIDYLSALVPNPFAGLIPTSASLNGSTISRQSLLTPFPQFTGITLQASNAASSYFHSLDVRVEKRYSHGLTILSNFTYSKLISEDNYKNATDLVPEKRVASDDRPLRFVLSGSYQLPFGKGKHFASHSGNREPGDWWMGDQQHLHQSDRRAALLRQQPALLRRTAECERPPLQSGCADVRRHAVQYQQHPTTRQQHQYLRQPLWQRAAGWRGQRGLSLIKDTAITEHVKLQFRFEAFNAFNRPSFDPPNLTVTSSAFGKITTQPNLPRSIQMALRLAW